MTQKQTITAANISINEHGTPSSIDYDDIYFANNSGIEETQYVFLEGNSLWQRWLDYEDTSFCIAETGFGTGLNFFTVAQAFLTFIEQHPEHPLQHLSFISTEKHPIARKDAQTIIAKWSDFQALTCQWLAQYPMPVAGVHRSHFGAHITLDLHYNEASAALDNIQVLPNANVDAWFLDGFAPSKNESMWQDSLFNAMARLTKINGTFATFTAAGFVKRGLAKAGFEVKKRKGFAHKREMLVGKLPTRDILAPQQVFPNKDSAPYFARHASTSKHMQSAPVTIVGNGLAGAILALKLCQLRIPVDLIWQGDAPADGASGAPIGGFYPQLNAQNNHSSQLQLHCFLYARRFYDALFKQSEFDHDWCGALQLGFNDNTQMRLQKMQAGKFWPDDVAYLVDADNASQIANIAIPYKALYMPDAGWISPSSLVDACIRLASSTGLLNLRPNTQLKSFVSPELRGSELGDINQAKIEIQLEHHANKQSMQTNETCRTLVLATGYGSQHLLQPDLPLRVTRGQIELLQSQAPFSQLKTLLCHKGYFTPANKGIHALGSTYVKDDTNTQVRASETAQNFAMHEKSMAKASWLSDLIALQDNNNGARASVRCSSPDHLPVVGSLPSAAQERELADLYKALPVHHYPRPSVKQNVFVMTALGSRGLTTAPLLAELLLSQILGRSLPFNTELLNALNPNRFLIRDLIRRHNN